RFTELNSQLAQLSRLEQELSAQAHAAAKAEFRVLGMTMAGLVLLSIVLSMLVTMRVRRAMLADIQMISEVVGHLAEGRLMNVAATSGRDEIADTSRALDHTISILTTTLRSILDSVR